MRSIQCTLSAFLLFYCATTPALHNPFSDDTPASINTPLIQTCVVPVHYANAKNIAAFLNQSSLQLLSTQGHAGYYARTNVVALKDDAAHLARAKKMIGKLDQPTQQVLIRAKILNVDKNYLHSLGVVFDNTTHDDISVTQDTVRIPIIALKNAAAVSVQISALESEGHATLIAKPELIAMNHQSASIESGDEVPYQASTSSGATSVSFKKAVLRLKVTPTVLPHHQVLLHIAVNQDKVSALNVNGVPAIRTQQMQTQTVLHANDTAVLGGIFENTHSITETGVPILRHVPILGVLFRRKKQISENRELLIFVSARLI